LTVDATGEVTDESFRILKVRAARLADLLDQFSEVDIGGCVEFSPVYLFSDRTLQQLRRRKSMLF
jgi:hypothetical protein